MMVAISLLFISGCVVYGSAEMEILRLRRAFIGRWSWRGGVDVGDVGDVDDACLLLSDAFVHIDRQRSSSYCSSFRVPLFHHHHLLLLLLLFRSFERYRPFHPPKTQTKWRPIWRFSSFSLSFSIILFYSFFFVFFFVIFFLSWGCRFVCSDLFIGICWLFYWERFPCTLITFSFMLLHWVQLSLTGANVTKITFS